MPLQIAQDEIADEVLSTNAFALLAGMLLDQQFPMERAFAGPAKILDRFGTLDPAAIAEAPPGFGRQKAQIFVALLGKQLDVRPPGWEQAAGVYAEPGSYRSVADVVDAASLERV